MINGGYYEGEWYDCMRDGYGIHVFIIILIYSIGLMVDIMKVIGKQIKQKVKEN